MEREGRPPLRILRQALRISEVFITVLFLPNEILPPVLGKYFQTVEALPMPLGFFGE